MSAKQTKAINHLRLLFTDSGPSRNDEKRKMRFHKGRNPKHQVDLEALTEGPHRIRFDLFHRPKAIVGSVHAVPDGGTGNRPRAKNSRPKVNLFPQISLTDLRDEDLNNVLEFMYSSDWKEASAFCARASSTNLSSCDPTVVASRVDITHQYTECFRKRSPKVRYTDLPRSDVDLAKWYKSFV